MVSPQSDPESYANIPAAAQFTCSKNRGANKSVSA